MQTRSATRRLNAAAATAQTTQTTPSVNVIQEQNTPASSRGVVSASGVGATEEFNGGSSSSKSLRTPARLPPPNKLRTTISDEEKARSMEMFDPFSEASLFTGPLTPYSSPHQPTIPLPSEFDVALGIDGEFESPTKRGQHGDAAPCRPLRRTLIGSGSHWSMRDGPGDVLVKTDLEWKEKELDTTNRTRLEVELDIMIFKRDEREMLLASIPDNSMDMDVDSAIVVNTPIVPTLGPEGTIIIDPVEEARELSRQQAEAEYPSEWVERAGESQELRTHPTELLIE